jgi:hypothetical protein
MGNVGDRKRERKKEKRKVCLAQTAKSMSQTAD